MKSVRIFIDEPFEQGHDQDLDVHQVGPVLDVVEVVFDSLPDGGIAAVAIHLSPAGDAGTDLMLDVVAGNLLLELLDEEGTLRARPDQTHVTLEDIEDLRQLVDTGLPDEFPDRRDAGVIPLGPGLLLLGRILHLHGAELVHLEFLVVEADTHLLEDQRSRRRRLDDDRDDDHRDAEDDQHNDSAEQIRDPLDHPVDGVRQRDVADVDDRKTVQVFGVRRGRNDVAVVRDELGVHTGLLTGRDNSFEHGEILQLQGDGDLVKGMLGEHLREDLRRSDDLDSLIFMADPALIIQNPVDVVAPLRIRKDPVDVALGRLAVADKQDVLLVEAAQPRLVEDIPQKIAERQAEEDVDAEEKKDERTRDVHLPERGRHEPEPVPPQGQQRIQPLD